MNDRSKKSSSKTLWVQKSVIGGIVGFVAIAIFLFPIDNPELAWGKFWMAKPVLIVTLAGMVGGTFYHLITAALSIGWKKILGIVLGSLIYIFGLWIGTVLGLNGTLWN